MDEYSKDGLAVWWIRRDLRLEDNAALFHALTSGRQVVPLFIFDKHILDLLDASDRRVVFIHQQLQALQTRLSKMGSTLVVRYGTPEEVWPELVTEWPIKAVYTNHDYEPYARKRDPQIATLLAEKDVSFHTYKDQVIFEKEEILTGQGNPYTVFTPFSKNWRISLRPEMIAPFETEPCFYAFWKQAVLPIPALDEMGFVESSGTFPGQEPDEAIIRVYDQQRDFPAVAGTTRMGIHLRFGTISIRQLVRDTRSLNEVYLNELIWREFYMQILWNFPHVVEGPFRAKYAHIPWRNDEGEFQAWCEGKTGYPLVDAGMRELNETGYMHNRVRMVVASFLTKHLLINWQWGEAWFAEKLLDFELAANNGGWQWAAGCGTDAAPYFRVFNPESQMKKFDPQAKYIRKWVPEFGTPTYPRPIVEHKVARQRAIDTYKTALQAFS